MSKDRFEIHGREYLLPEAFRMGDPVLVEEVTGLEWGDFSDRVDDAGNDPIVMIGMLAVSVWQTNPRWKRDRVARFVEAIRIEDVKYLAGDEPEEETSPPVEGESAEVADLRSTLEKPLDSHLVESRSFTTPDGLHPITPVSV